MVKKETIRVRVAGILLNKKNELLLVNHQKNGKSYWLFPGGGVEYGEGLEEALKREFKEELDLKIRGVKHLVFMNDTVYPGGKRHILNLHFKVTAGAEFRVKPEGPFKGAQFVSMDIFKKILFYPHAKSVILSLWKRGFKDGLGYIKIGWKQ